MRLNFINSTIRCLFKKIFLAFGLYVAFIVVIIPKGMPWISQTVFVLYALFIFWIVWSYVWEETEQKKNVHAKFFLCLLLGSGVLFVFTRLFLFARYGEAPFGYDTGFYLKSMDSVFDGGLSGHRAFRSLLWVPFLWMGIPKVYILHGLYIFFQFLILGSLYTLARTFTFSNRLQYAAVIVFLFAISLPQFLAFWWMFYQMEMALAFLLMTIALIHRRSWLAFVTAGFGAAIHPATFLPFVATLFIAVFIQLVRILFFKKKIERETLFMMIMGAIVIILIRQVAGEFILTYLRGSVNDYGWFLTNYPDYLKVQFTGLYVGFDAFRLANTYILPFGMLGVLLFVFNKLPRQKENLLSLRLLFVLVFLAISFVLSYYPFIYQNRFLIILDLTLILFAVYPFIYLFNHLLADNKGRLIVMLLLFGLGLYIVYPVLKQEPQLYPDERQELKALVQVADPTDFVMSTESLYTPWVYAFADHPTIDPGYLQHNQWTYTMWREFWYGKSDARRHELLHLYNKPIYIFVGSRVPETIAYRKFIETDLYFIQVSPHIWRYDPMAITNEEIIQMYSQEAL